ncbi:hypothetical protein K402DRAFT_25432 [Aulographum hederae CBS 113979]|uniref:Uncharacterized protein n=1 Tax=Aulographum hederae CBS 113979 TaxID=1176131 RepID=A0A6G1H626_9PEZI|nr:hypothetical protein K402DRAFT_25432 [Aulographum hederae CBS 113979]
MCVATQKLVVHWAKGRCLIWGWVGWFASLLLHQDWFWFFSSSFRRAGGNVIQFSRLLNMAFSGGTFSRAASNLLRKRGREVSVSKLLRTSVCRLRA